MKIYAYKGCNTCITVACCSQVCDPYKKEIKEKYKMIINASSISLDVMEHTIFRYLMWDDTKGTPVSVDIDASGNICINTSFQLDNSVENIQLTMSIKEFR